VTLTSSPEQPLPVRTVARAIGDWVHRLGRVWVEGQLTEISRRPGMNTVFMTLRDPVAAVSLRLTCTRAVCEAVGPGLVDGARVVVWAKPSFHPARGTLALAATEIQLLGAGALLARIEGLRRLLAAEGLFAAERKRRPPFLPRAIGLVTGRASAAERDVVENARRRWPAVHIVRREVAVQGPLAVGQIIDALGELDALAEVEVVIVARGGGSVEDLLPFSDETLLRTVVAMRTPVVSAIGHEQDAPLLDFVADVRASTPTDAAKRVVPDVGEQTALIATLRGRARRALEHRLDREERRLSDLRGRPSLARPDRELARQAEAVDALRDRARRRAREAVHRAEADLVHALARVRALSPAATLERGYAVVLGPGATLVRSPDEVAVGDALSIRLALGELAAAVTRTDGTSDDGTRTDGTRTDGTRTDGTRTDGTREYKAGGPTAGELTETSPGPA